MPVSGRRAATFIAIGFFCGAASMRLWSMWQAKMANSCEALLSRQNIRNPFHLTGNDCAIMDVSKGYKAQEQTTFPPESIAVWRGRAVKVLGRNRDAVVVKDCPSCLTAWLAPDANGRTIVRTSPEVP
jgi:hypothetical protein